MVGVALAVGVAVSSRPPQGGAIGPIGAGVGAVGGGLVGALTQLGFEQDEAEYYDTGVRNGRTLVTVHDDDGQSESIFDETCAGRYRRPSTGTTSRVI